MCTREPHILSSLSLTSYKGHGSRRHVIGLIASRILLTSAREIQLKFQKLYPGIAKRPQAHILYQNLMGDHGGTRRFYLQKKLTNASQLMMA